MKIQSRTFWTFLALMSFVMFFGGFFYEMIGKVKACRMCLIQRSLFLIIGIFSSFTGLVQSQAIQRFLSWCTTILVMGLFLASTYHVGLQYKWILPQPFCSVHSTKSTLDQFIGMPSASCQDRTLEIMGIPASLYAMVFSLLSLLMCFRIVRKGK
jgi:disulfide bond formation protein DsbB